MIPHASMQGLVAVYLNGFDLGNMIFLLIMWEQKVKIQIVDCTISDYYKVVKCLFI